MAERKIKTEYQGQIVDGVEVPMVESIDRWSELKLEDGSQIRLKLSVLSVIRVDGIYDPDGNPTYVLKMTPTMAVSEAPEHLRKKK